MLADGSAVDCRKTPKKNETDGFSFDLEPASEAPKRCVSDVPQKFRCWFDHFVGVFLKEICTRDLLRPLPPMIGNGQRVDLVNLFWVVRRRGGFDANSKLRVWDSVAEECGFDLSLGWAVKLVYVKYLHLLERVIENKDLEWSLASTGIEFGEQLMDLDDVKEFFSEISDRKVKDRMYPHFEMSPKSLKGSNEVGNDIAVCRIKKSGGVDGEDLDLDSRSVANVLDGGKYCDDGLALSGGDRTRSVNMRDMRLDSTKSMEEGGKCCGNDEVKSEVGESGRGKDGDDCDEDVKISDPSTVEEVSSLGKRKRELFGSEVGESHGGKKYGNTNDNVTILDPSTADEVNSPCKRKQELLCEMLNWVKMAAKDPSDPAVGALPERSKWKSFEHEKENWMRVLLAREAIFQKRQANSGAEINWQKNHKMHPSMYEDIGSAYNLRERLRLEKKLDGTPSQSGANSDSSSASSDLGKSSPGVDDCFLGTSEYSSSHLDKCPPSRIPQGPNYQAHVPEWTGHASGSEMKWVCSRVWPLEKPENKYLIERDPIGKGRQDSCGCPMPGSTECVAFHVSEKRLRVKRELGPAFYLWQFNQMGVEVGLSWTAEEEKKFDDIIKSNPPSLGYGFWDDIFQSFSKKSRKELVSYYFNVFLFRRRGYQNRFTPDHIDSDDEELELGSVTNGSVNEEPKSSKSILNSPQKPHAKYRPV